MEQPEQILGTFSITDEDDEPQSGYIVRFIGWDGDAVDDMSEAASFIGYVVEGSAAGMMVEIPADDENWTQHKLH